MFLTEPPCHLFRKLPPGGLVVKGYWLYVQQLSLGGLFNLFASARELIYASISTVNRCSQDCELLRLRKEESSQHGLGLGV